MRRLLGLGILMLVAGCDSGTEDRPHVSSTGVVMRPHEAIPDGAVPRGAAVHAAALAQSPPVTPDLLRHGEQRFQVFCSPCHGRNGRGDGLVVSRGFPRPPSYFEPRLLAAPPAHLVDVMTYGRGMMLPYADRIPPADRWAIAHFVKALQAERASQEIKP